jgi:hypothetical protein|tara:strand:- start:337 stop:819 length:483 start_codon:yes stop_codon:yes gene_type:complete
MTLMAVVREFLDGEQIVATDANQPDTVFFRFEGEQLTWQCFVDVREDLHQVLVYSVYPDKVPTLRRLNAAEYLTRINYGLPVGNFEMDLTDGEVRFKASLDCSGDRLSVALMRQLIRASATLTDRFAEGLRLVAEQAVSPIEAVRITEGRDPHPQAVDQP